MSHFLRSLTLFALLALGAITGQAASFQAASVIVDTEANVLAKTGTYTGQRAVLTNRNSAEMYWNGSAWKWAHFCQPMSLLRTAFTVTAASTSEDTGMTYTLPAVGANDMLLVNHFWTVTNNANAKTARVNLDGAAGQAIDLASQNVGNLVAMMRNMNSASVQKWFSNNRAVYGGTSSSLQGTTKATGTAGLVLTVTGQKATGSDTMTLEWADIWICGGD